MTMLRGPLALISAATAAALGSASDTSRGSSTLVLPPANPATYLTRNEAPIQGHHYYVADVVGDWEVLGEQGGAATNLGPLAKLRPTARVRYTGPRDAEATALLVIRDPRSLGKATIRCSGGTSCSRPLELVKVRFERRGAAVPAGTGALYAAVAERDAMRQRIRLVGARGQGTTAGLDADVLVMVDDRGSVDLAALRSAIAPSGGWVARFCTLAAGADADECLASRRLLATDCESAAPKCTPGVTGAVRVDVFIRERAMLSSVAIASGFAVLVPAGEQRAAMAERDRLLSPIRPERGTMSAEEWRALLAAAAMAVESASR
ncbi:MAG: hypothetical protein ACT4OZ_04215 [Gemmatimonadota bacterium]